MKIVHIVAGAGGMYCGSCLHGNTLVAALRGQGSDAWLVPAYTPLRTDEENQSVGRVVYGGVNVYLQQASVLFHHTPRLLDRLLDRPGLLRWIARRSSTTRPEDLGPLAVSMLRGEEGRQRKELDKLVDWLASEVRPDVVHLNNALLVGMARQIIRKLHVPVVCDLSGEDSFVEKLPEPHRHEAIAIMQDRCRDLAALVAMNRYFADFMAGYLAVPRERIRVIRPGLDLRGHRAPGETPVRPQAAGGQRTPAVIGFLGRVCPDKGLHLLAEAFVLLAADRSLGPVRLEAAGHLADGDRHYLAAIQRRLTQSGLADRFRYHGELDRPGKIAFLQSLSVMCTPSVYRESKGLPVLEAWANGVPVVVPDHGAFPEMIADTGGGLAVAPNDPAALAAGLQRMLENPDFASECGRRAHLAVHEHHGADQMAQRTIQLYQEICTLQT
jgi:glycosyltransferase involved in cell wall biosynthesis